MMSGENDRCWRWRSDESDDTKCDENVDCGEECDEEESGDFVVWGSKKESSFMAEKPYIITVSE